MSNFEYMNFNDGDNDTEFVAHAKKYTQQDAVELFIMENSCCFTNENANRKLLREPTINDVKTKYARYYPHNPYFSGGDDDQGSCYSYCKDGERGGFPVWVIDFDDLLEATK